MIRQAGARAVRAADIEESRIGRVEVNPTFKFATACDTVLILPCPPEINPYARVFFKVGGRYAVYAEVYRELGMPSHYDLEPVAGGAEKYNLPNDHFDPMILEKQFATGYYFPQHGWVKEPVASSFRNTPWPDSVQKELDDFVNNRRDVVSAQAERSAQLPVTIGISCCPPSMS